MNTKKILGIVAVLVLVALAMVGAGAADDDINWGNNVAQLEYPDGTTTSMHDTIKDAVVAWNVAPESESAYVITVRGADESYTGIYEESGMVIYQYNNKKLIIQAEEGKKVTISPDYDETKLISRYVFLISGLSQTGNDSSVMIKNIDFDLSGNLNNADVSAVVYLASGGSGIEDPIKDPLLSGVNNGAHRYAHNVTIENSNVKGDCTDKVAGYEKTMVVYNGNNSQPFNITLKNIVIDNVSYLTSGYFVKSVGLYGLKVVNCRTKENSNCKAFVNDQGSSTTIIENCTVETFHDYSVRTNGCVDIRDTKFTITKNGSYGSNTGVITLRGASQTSVISNCTIDKGSNAATGMYDIYSTKDYVTINDGNEELITTLNSGEGYNFPVYVAQIGENKYYSLKDAVTAVESNQTINILVDEISFAGISLSDDRNYTIAGLLGEGGVPGTTVTAGTTATALNDKTLQNFIFSEYNVFTWCYVGNGKTATLKNCKFDMPDWGIHFDGSTGGSVVINNCTVNGICAFYSGLTSVTISNSTFGLSSEGYAGIACYGSNVVIQDCSFSEHYATHQPTATHNGIRMCTENGFAELYDCTVDGNYELYEIVNYDGNYVGASWCVAIDPVKSGDDYTGGIFVGNPNHTSLCLALLASNIVDGYTARVYNDMENVWEVVTATQTTLIYNANGGTSNIWNDTGAKDRQVTVTSESPVRTGYTFVNWNTESDGEGTPYAAGAQFNLGSDIILYAQWTPNDYTVTFNNNGGSGVMNAQQFTYGTAGNLNENTFSKGECKFSGWATSASGSVVYADKQSICDVGNVTLYAVWTEEAKTYGVGGTISGASGTVTVELKQGNTVIKTIENATSPYNFTGVSDELYNVVATDIGSGKVVTIAVLVSGGDVTNANIEFPSESVNSKVVIETANDTPNVIVSNVDQEAIKRKSTGKVVTVTATVAKEVKAEVPVTETEKVMVQDAISKLEEEKGVTESQVYYNLTVKKQVGSEDATNITETKEVLAFSIPCDANMKVNGVIRYHDDKVQNLTEDDSGNDATYQNVGDKVVIYAKCFSVYAITYSNADPSATTVTMNVAEQYSFSIPDSVELTTTVDTAKHGEIKLTANPGSGTKVSIKLGTQADETNNHIFYLSSSTSDEKAKYSLSVSKIEGSAFVNLKNVLTGSEVPGYASSQYSDANNIVLRIKEDGIVSGTTYYLDFTTKEVPNTAGTYTGTLTFDLRVES